MAELNEQDIAQIRDTHDTVIELRTILLGANGSPGLCKKVEKATEELVEVHKNHSDLKRKFYILVAFMVGSGVLGTGIWAALQ
ncbi:MAG: hypothetical protein PHD09_06735 [Candidatus Omnitrophica bacterium]|nr:hypothetical protein [Candidatus Omnitrophota bacterium]